MLSEIVLLVVVLIYCHSEAAYVMWQYSIIHGVPNFFSKSRIHIFSDIILFLKDSLARCNSYGNI